MTQPAPLGHWIVLSIHQDLCASAMTHGCAARSALAVPGFGGLPQGGAQMDTVARRQQIDRQLPCIVGDPWIGTQFEQGAAALHQTVATRPVQRRAPLAVQRIRIGAALQQSQNDRLQAHFVA